MPGPPPPGEPVEIDRRFPFAPEVVRVRPYGRPPLDVVRVLDYWQHPKFGQTQAATMRVVEAFRLLVSDAPGGPPYEVTLHQYGKSNHRIWHMRRVLDQVDRERP